MRKATPRGVEAGTVVWDFQNPTSKDDKDLLQGLERQVKTLKEIEYRAMVAIEKEELVRTHERCLTPLTEHRYPTPVFNLHQMARMVWVEPTRQLGPPRAWMKY